MHEIAVRIEARHAEAALDALLPLLPGGVLEVPHGEELELRIRGALPGRDRVMAAARPWLKSVTERKIPDELAVRRALDWEPEVIAERIVVRPSWAPAAPRDYLEVVLEEAAAFGTGAHPTTRACLAALTGLPSRGAFCDLGCGSGILAIAAAKLGWDPVLAIDVDPDAVEVTRANAQRNDVRVHVRATDLRYGAVPAARTVVANVPLAIHAAMAVRLPAPAVEHLLVSGVLVDEAPAAIERYAAAGFAPREVVHAGEWALIRFCLAGELVEIGAAGV